MRTPHQALARLVADDPTRPALTFYDDTPGPTQGERIEISRRGLVAAAGSAVVLASHHAPLVEAVADRVVDLG